MIARRILHGTHAGLIGGLAFGAFLGTLGMLPMIGELVGDPSALTGLVVHMANSALIGAGFGFLLGGLATEADASLNYGLLYGGAWWLLGPLTLMPILLGHGLGANWNLVAAGKMLPSLLGHLTYGAILGISYGQLQGQRFLR